MQVSSMKRPVFSLALVASILVSQFTGTLTGLLPAASAADDQVESKVSQLMSKLTLDEKISMLGGHKDEMHVPGVQRLGIPELKFSDGPVGVRCWGRSTCYPAGAMLAATFDEDAAFAMGKALGRDSRARGVHVLLAPGCDLYRVAQCGRNFEYFGEDPYLSSRIVVGYVKGVQSEGVATSVKHYAANDQEVLRDSVDTIVDERRMHEICLPPFKAGIQEANAWTVMAAYNKVNGEWCTANSYLLNDVLRKQWGFKGVLMSDWGAVHESLGPLTAGCDLEMGRLDHFKAENVKNLIKEGKITEQTVDEHVRRWLRMIVAMGFMDRAQEDKSIPKDDPASADAALRVAREGLVLLKNEKNLLPIDRASARSVVVLGPNACPAITGGGGSSGTEPFGAISVLDAIKNAAGDKVKVSYIPNWIGPNPTATNAFNSGTVYDLIDGKRGLMAEYFANPEFQGKPQLSKVDSSINFMWGAWRPANEIQSDAYSVRWKGKMTAAQSDDYVFACASDGAKVYLDGKLLFDCSSGKGIKNACKTMKLSEGEAHDLLIEYSHRAGQSLVQFNYGRANEDFNSEEAKLIAEADLVVASLGFNGFTESEGYDRPYDLPAPQLRLLKNTSRLNAKTLVLLNCGGNVGMQDWIDSINGLMHAWYPGQNGNQAVAEAIFGDISPSGKLPDTFEVKFEDSPAFGNYPGSPDNGGRVEYKEGIFVGYRWFDKKNIVPRYPFGFGLSYTQFAMQNLKLEKKDKSVDVSVELTNTGKRKGAEVVQVYLRALNSKLDRPVQELKAFKRVELEAGETKTLSFSLGADAFSAYSAKDHGWIYFPAGQYEIALGNSSRNILCSDTISWGK